MENPENFWKFVSKERFPMLKNAALKLFSMSESTYMYICECAFSTMNIVKSKNRNQLAWKHHYGFAELPSYGHN